jgi:hypothetical protein
MAETCVREAAAGGVREARPESFLAIHLRHGRALRPRAEIEARRELCEDVAPHAAAFSPRATKKATTPAEPCGAATTACAPIQRRSPRSKRPGWSAAWPNCRSGPHLHGWSMSTLTPIGAQRPTGQSIRRQREGARSSAENHFGCDRSHVFAEHPRLARAQAARDFELIRPSPI